MLRVFQGLFQPTCYARVARIRTLTPPRPVGTFAAILRDMADKIARRFGCEFQPTGERGVAALMVLPHAQGQMTSPIEACVAELTRYGVLPARLIY